MKFSPQCAAIKFDKSPNDRETKLFFDTVTVQSALTCSTFFMVDFIRADGVSKQGIISIETVLRKRPYHTSKDFGVRLGASKLGGKFNKRNIKKRTPDEREALFDRCGIEICGAFLIHLRADSIVAERGARKTLSHADFLNKDIDILGNKPNLR